MNEEKQLPCIHSTVNYEKFRLHREQRELKPDLINKLMKSMKERGFVASMPITIDMNWTVYDGQHRLQAAKNLGLPVYYIIWEGLTVTDIREMARAQKAWNFEDYITSQCHQGNDNYIRFRKLRERSGLNWEAFCVGSFPTTWSTMRHEIRAGRLTLTERKEGEIVEFIEKFMPFKELFPKGWFHRHFVGALAYLFSHKDFDYQQLLDRLSYQSTRLVRCADTADYVMLLQQIYNYKSHGKNIVDFAYRRR